QLAFILAHELMHNLKGHLKDFTGTNQLMGHFHELEADSEALKLMAKAGYKPQAAVDSLYALGREMDRLEKEYPTWGRDRGELAQALARVRDVHPHEDIRRANMLDHIDEARELYAPARPGQDVPIWMQRRLRSARLSDVDRFDIRIRKAASADAVDAAVWGIEAFIQAQAVKYEVGEEKKAVIENAYRSLLSRVRTQEELRTVEVSIRRQHIRLFPSKRLSADVHSRQLELLARTFPPQPTLEDFMNASVSLPDANKRNGTLRYLGYIRDRRTLDAAFKVLNYGAETLGFDRKLLSYGDDWDVAAGNLARRLWSGMARVLRQELGRMPKPEEVIAALKAGLSPAWLADYRMFFIADIIDSAFGRQEARSQYRPSQLAKLLFGLPQWDSNKSEPLKAQSDGNKWTDRRYKAENINNYGGKVSYNYEHYYIRGLSAPSLQDQLDISSVFMAGAPSRPLVRILRRDGKFEAFMSASIRKASDVFRERLKYAADAHDKDRAVADYSEEVNKLLRSALLGVKDLKLVRQTVAAAWQPMKEMFLAEDAEHVLDQRSRSLLASRFVGSMSNALRQAVIGNNMAGARPAPEDLQALRVLVRDVEATLRPLSGLDLIRAYTRYLSRNLHDDRAYADAYSVALWGAPFERVPLLELAARLAAHVPSWLGRKFLQGAVTRAKTRAAHARISPDHDQVEGIPEADRRKLSQELDFAYFLTLAGDPDVDVDTKLMSAALLDRLDMGYDKDKQDSAGRAIGMRAAAAVGRWLLEDAAAQSQGPAAMGELARKLLRLGELHPGLLQPDMATNPHKDKVFREGAAYVRRSEPYRSFAKQEHPVRGINVRWAAETLRKLDAAQAWPAAVEDRFDLLDFLNGNGEFSDLLDQRIIDLARQDPAGFRRWVARDRARLQTWAGGDDRLEQIAFDQIAGSMPAVPTPQAQPLRIVRNPNLRVQLFELLPEGSFSEAPPRVPIREWWQTRLRLYKAYRAAREHFSSDFLQGLQQEGSMEDKIFETLEEIDRVAAEAAEQARQRWDSGKFRDDEMQGF
ncbi:MAG: hypothetical protein WC881_10735, partial [Elusimicrobiota bacterium]